MSTVTYIIDTNADRYLIVDGERETAAEWFEKSLPGDEVEELREAPHHRRGSHERRGSRAARLQRLHRY